jgi:multicomponent Na+:H+ antiporter subunit G
VNPGEVVASVAILLGSALALVAGIGLVRLPDVFARMHAATKPATLGLVLICLGAGVTDAELADVAKLVLVVVLQFLTAPVGAHMVGRAAYHAGGLLHADTVLDELAATEPRRGAGDDAGPTTAR